MAKKYLSLEEAAEQLGLAPEALVKLREAGELRGFADRGTWKFLAATITEYARSQQAGSDPDIQMFETEEDTDEDVMMIGDVSVHDDDDYSDLSASDSDVRLMLDDSMAPDIGSTPDIKMPGSESLSDVRLTGDDSSLKLNSSDSDVQIVGGSDSDVVLDIGSDSDSDVAIVGSDSDSDVKVLNTESDLRLPSLGDSDSDVLVGTDSDIGLAGTQFDEDIFESSDSDVSLVSDTMDDIDMNSSDSDVALIVSDEGSAVTLEIDGEDMSDLENASSLILDPGDGGSGITLESSDSGIDFGAVDSGISLESIGSGLGSGIGSGITLDADSGISLEAADSGISLEAADSGISLEAADSGISLESMDSGISLDAGSGISLEDADDSGIALDEDMSSTMPMQSLDTTDFSEVDKTQEVASLGSSSEFELAGLDDDDEDVGSDTSVLLFDDDEFEEGDGTAAELAAVAAVGGAAIAGAAAIKDTDEVDSFDDDGFDDDDEFDDFEDEDDDDELLGADDDDFEGDFEDDDAEMDFEKAPATAGGGVSRGADYEWGTWPFVGLCLSTLLMTGCFLVGFDLVRSMWAYSDPSASGWLLNLLGGLFG